MPGVAALCFGIAILMHLFGWGSGRIDVEFFALLGLLCAVVPLGRPSVRWLRRKQEAPE